MERDLDKKPKRAKRTNPETNIVGDSSARNAAGRQCKTCAHPRRADVERMLLEGTPFSRIEAAIATGDKTVDPTDVAIKHHAQRCIPEIMEQRREKFFKADELTADLISKHLAEALAQSKQSAEMAFDEEENALGRSSAITTRVTVSKAAGELCGLFKGSTKLELLLRAPETSALLDAILDAVCPDCAQRVRDVMAQDESE